MRSRGVDAMQKVKTKTIIQKINFQCTPHELYDALMDSKKHSHFTDAKAVISDKIGGSFSTYGGYSSGKNVELVKDKKIVQTWRAEDWPDGHFSAVTFEMKKSPSGGTLLVFTQEELPVSVAKDIEAGWKLYYWKPLKLFLEK